jgi:hypothetical protein
MTDSIPAGARVTVAKLREILGVPRMRREYVRDVLAVPCGDGDPLPDGDRARSLALDDLPEEWQANPDSGPQYLVVLRGLARPWRIAGVWETDPARWGEDAGADPQHRLVPLLTEAYIPSAVLTGALLDAPLVFGWLNREEQYAFL